MIKFSKDRYYCPNCGSGSIGCTSDTSVMMCKSNINENGENKIGCGWIGDAHDLLVGNDALSMWRTKMIDRML